MVRIVQGSGVLSTDSISKSHELEIVISSGYSEAAWFDSYPLFLV